MLSIGSWACGSFLHLMWRNVYSDNFLFINLLLVNCESSSCILHTSTLSDMWFTNIFSTLRNFHFAAWIFLILLISNLFFPLVTLFLVKLKSSCLTQGPDDLLLCFLLRVYGFSSYILSDSFWVNFCVWCREMYSFIRLCVGVWLSGIICYKDSSSPFLSSPTQALVPLQKICWAHMRWKRIIW